MTERPILFSAPMVRAILDGRKTQTRRVVKHPHARDIDAWAWNEARQEWDVGVYGEGGVLADMRDGMRCHYGQPGDLLWVRESFVYRHKHNRYYYRADHEKFDPYAHNGWKPSIFMPRLASRITLEVTGVRVQRLHAITEEDAQAEGARRFDGLPSTHPYGLDARWSMETPESTRECLGTARLAFGNLWNRLNGQGAWEANPWVWVVEFRKVALRDNGND